MGLLADAGCVPAIVSDAAVTETDTMRYVPAIASAAVGTATESLLYVPVIASIAAGTVMERLLYVPTIANVPAVTMVGGCCAATVGCALGARAPADADEAVGSVYVGATPCGRIAACGGY